jgi:hypothetical protein
MSLKNHLSEKIGYGLGDTASSMLTARMVDGKDWMNKKTDNEEIETKKDKKKKN